MSAVSPLARAVVLGMATTPDLERYIVPEERTPLDDRRSIYYNAWALYADLRRVIKPLGPVEGANKLAWIHAAMLEAEGAGLVEFYQHPEVPLSHPLLMARPSEAGYTLASEMQAELQ